MSNVTTVRVELGARGYDILIGEGLLARTPRGRVATPLAWTHLGMTPPPSATALGQAGLFE